MSGIRGGRRGLGGHRGLGLGADLRLARRQVVRTKGSSLLVMLLIALPVIALSGLAVFWQSSHPTPLQQVTAELGHADAWVQVTGAPNPTRTQAVGNPYATTTTGPDSDRPAPTGPGAVIPSGTHTITMYPGSSIAVKTATGIGAVGLTAGPAWDAALRGRYVIIDGRAPASAAEAMATPGLLKRTGSAIGGTVTLADSGRTLTITGTLRQATEDPGDEMLYAPTSAVPAEDLSSPQWFTVGWQPDAATLARMNHDGLVAFARSLVLDPPTGTHTDAEQGTAAGWQVLVIGTIAAAFSGYLVVLLAGAAFAVAARRQQRTLAVLAGVGATRGHLFRVVVLQGAVLGVVAGLGAAAIGVGAAAAVQRIAANGVLGSFWNGWGLHVPWTLVGMIALFAVVTGALAAVVPARTAARGDVLGALRGARRPVTLSPRRPLWGLGLMIAGAVASVVGASALVAMGHAADPEYSSPVRLALLAALVAGPVVFQVGVILSGHWTLTMIARVLSRLGLAPRIAARDAAATPSRVVPAFAAISACVMIACFALSATAMVAASAARQYSWNGHLGVVSVHVWGADAAAHRDAYTTAAKALVAPSDPASTAVVTTPADPPTDPQTGAAKDPHATVWATSPTGARCRAHACDPSVYQASSDTLSVASPHELAAILGAPLPADVADTLRSGGAVIVSEGGLPPRFDGHITISAWAAGRLAAFNDALNTDSSAAKAVAEDRPRARHVVPARVFTGTHAQSYLNVVITPQTARAFGMTLAPSMLFATYDTPPSNAVVDAMAQAAQNTRVGRVDDALGVTVERGPAPIDPALWAITAATLVLVVGAGAVCLGLARFERRPDDATLAAVGAAGGLRRRVNAWQGLVIVGAGTVVGAATSILPAWGVARLMSMPFADMPWPWLVVLAVGLPAVIAAGAWLVPPRRSDLTHRTAIA